VTVVGDRTMTGLDSRVTVRLRDGREYTMFCDDCKGTPTMPLTDEEWRERLHDLRRYAAIEISTATADKLLDTLFALEESDDVLRDLVVPLMP